MIDDDTCTQKRNLTSSSSGLCTSSPITQGFVGGFLFNSHFHHFCHILASRPSAISPPPPLPQFLVEVEKLVGKNKTPPPRVCAQEMEEKRKKKSADEPKKAPYHHFALRLLAELPQRHDGERLLDLHPDVIGWVLYTYMISSHYVIRCK